MTHETVHACPTEATAGLTLCCRRTPFELPYSDRMAVDQDLVTCPGPPSDPTLGGLLGPVPAPAARCECCDLPAYSCGRAVEARQRAETAHERRRLFATPGAIPADYAGLCSTCTEPFSVGDPILRGGSGWRSLLCCGPDRATRVGEWGGE